MPTIAQNKEKQSKSKQAYDYFIGKGYTPEQSSAIVGNLIRESNFNTTVVGTADDKGSQGIAQWHSDRLNKLKSMYGKDWNKLENQLEYIEWELNNTEKKAGDALRSAKDVYEAGAVVSDLYERPKVKFKEDKKRQKHVIDTYKSFFNSEYVPQQSESKTVTQNLNFLPIPNNIPTFAGVPDVELPQKKEEDKDVEELKQQTAEQNFLQELQNIGDREQIIAQQTETQRQQLPKTDYNQVFEQVKQFVEGDLVNAQQGGKKTKNMMSVIFNMMQRGASVETIVNQLIKMSVPRNIAIQVVQNAFKKPIEFRQQGGAYEQDIEWLNNWYQNRVIPDVNLQNAYSEDKPYYQDMINKPITIEQIETIKSGNSGEEAGGKVTGQYSSTDNKIYI